jgi:putative ABC transport system permease protein
MMSNLFYKNHELFKEIILNLKVHKLRTILTAFGIAWGVFILVVLLGISGGVQEGVFELFNGFSSKTMWFYGGVSTDNIAMRDTGEDIKFSVDEMENLKKIFPQITSISFDIQQPNTSVQFQGVQEYFNLTGASGETFQLKSLKISEGRVINAQDNKERRSVAVIGDRIVNRLFSKENPLGKHLTINGNQFLIVGILDNKSFLSVNEQNNIFIPVTSFSEYIRPVRYVNSIGITIKEGETKWFENKIRNYLSRRYHFNVDDPGALYVVNYEEQMSAFSKFFSGFNIFLVFVGCCLLLSGVIGVSNIMYIIVKERTHEIGVKKAIGATETAILKEFILESVVLTLVSGIAGFVLAMGALEIIDVLLSNLTDEEQIITHTVVEIKYMVLAILILSFSGLLAGFLPAQKAAEIKPVEAMTSI